MGLKIVFLDDSETTLFSVRSALQRAGHDVLTCTSDMEIGPEIRLADLVIIDFHLPGRSGEAVLRDIREKWNLHQIPPYFYLYTCDRRAGSQYRAMGFDGHFILKGNAKALVCQVAGAERTIALRQQRPHA